MTPWTRRRVTSSPDAPLVDAAGRLYQSLQRTRDKALASKARSDRRYASLAKHVAELYVELFRAKRELERKLDAVDRALLDRVFALHRGTDVEILCAVGEELTEELEEKVEILSALPRKGVATATIERVDQPTIVVGGLVFPGRVRVALPDHEKGGSEP
jgi:hypothetical protein